MARFIQCACGCGRLRSEFDIRHRKRIFIKGHYINILEPKSGPNHGGWKGGRRKARLGYIWIWKPDHPYSDRHGCIYEHRLVMENHLGRYLDPKEDIHHINGKRDDNRIENLQLMSHGEHTIFTHQGKKYKAKVRSKNDRRTRVKLL